MNKKSMERSPNDKCNKCAQSCSGGSNVWAEVVPGIVIVLIVYSPKPCGKLIPVEVSSGAGLKWLYICPPRNGALEVAGQACGDFMKFVVVQLGVDWCMLMFDVIRSHRCAQEKATAASAPQLACTLLWKPP